MKVGDGDRRRVEGKINVVAFLFYPSFAMLVMTPETCNLKTEGLSQARTRKGKVKEIENSVPAYITTLYHNIISQHCITTLYHNRGVKPPSAELSTSYPH